MGTRYGCLALVLLCGSLAACMAEGSLDGEFPVEPALLPASAKLPEDAPVTPALRPLLLTTREGRAFTVDDQGTRLAEVWTGGPAFDARWSPDGTLVAFRSDTAELRTVHAVRPHRASSVWGPVVVARDVRGAPTWSPDGTLIAYVVQASAPRTGWYVEPGQAICRSAPDAWAPPALSGVDGYYNLDWASDDRFYYCSWPSEVGAFFRWPGESFWDNGPCWMEAAAMAVAPGADRIAFLQPDGLHLDTLGPGTVLAPLGLLPLTKQAAEEIRSLRWARDGKRLAFVSPEGLFLVSVSATGELGAPTRIREDRDLSSVDW